jgi:TonB-linked SusC/RagA family outer membrane protein
MHFTVAAQTKDSVKTIVVSPSHADTTPHPATNVSLVMLGNNIYVKGKVRSDSIVLEGVTVYVKSNPRTITKTNNKGEYDILAPANGTLIFSFVGYKPLEVEIKGENKVSVTMQPENNNLNDVAVVAYGTQRKSSMVSAVTTIDPKEIKGPTSNLTTMLAGRISGIIAYQRSGEPGGDNASFFIRGVSTLGTGKVDPLIIIDGMESSTTDLARLQPNDIAGFSILKDATAAALYGARGANGVVLVTTKLGAEGKTKFNVNAENSLSSNTRNYKFADNITYMKLANEAVTTRDPFAPVPYSQDKIDHTAKGDDPYLYPNNNWLKEMIKDYTNNQRYNLNASGGSKTAKYYLSGTYNVDNGVLKVDKLNDFNSNIKLRNYEIRSNVTVNFTPTTQGIVRVSGQFDSYNGPNGGGGNIFYQALHANPVMFPKIFPSSYSPETKHPLFGNAVYTGSGASNQPGQQQTLYVNPYANEVSGYQQYNTSHMNAELDLTQDLRFVTTGLSAQLLTYTQRYSYFSVSRGYAPFYYGISYDVDKNPVLQLLNPSISNTGTISGGGTEYLSYSEGGKDVSTNNYAQLSLSYNRLFNKMHAVSGLLVGNMQNQLNGNAGSLQSSLPFRNMGLAGRFTYGYDNRYMAEFNFGYTGSERFAENHRFGFFPSAGLAWNISNEKFFGSFKRVINRFKIRATYGINGNDQIDNNPDHRFFYISNVNLNDGSKGATFGTTNPISLPGVSISRYENDNITWEKSYKTDIGVDMDLFNALSFVVDYYREHRTNLLQDRNTIPNTMGLSAPVQANIAETMNYGLEMSLTYNKTLNRYMWLQGRANFTYATSRYYKYEEPNYALKYRSVIGQPISRSRGLIAERLFVDDADVKNSPAQNFGEPPMAGDIKYKDIDGDGQINGDGDQVPLGFPQTPEITYGFGASFGFHNFDISAFFQGSGRSSFFISNGDIQPFAIDDRSNNTDPVSQHGLLKVIADNHWSENNRNLYAFWPRLSDHIIQNNWWNSTWWMENGEFLRLKQVELGYKLSPKTLRRIRFDNCRFYANATNLFVISKFKLWDPENASNGLGYPVQRVINLGVMLGF